MKYIRWNFRLWIFKVSYYSLGYKQFSLRTSIEWGWDK